MTTTIRTRRPGRPPGDRATPRIDVLLPSHEFRHRIRVAAATADLSLSAWLIRAAEEKLARDGAA